MCITLNKFFKTFGLNKKNYKDILIPYSGGTIIFVSLFISFSLFYFWREISFVKSLFFISVIILVYIIGILDDTLGSSNVKGLKGNIRSALVSKKISTGIIKAVFVIVIACYIYYFFNEEYWILKGILTALTTNLFNLFDLRPGRCIKFYYAFFFFLSFSSIRWTRELFIIFTIIITIYYFWDAYGFSMLGDSGSNLTGFIIGLILSEAIGTSLFGLIAFIIILITLQLILDKYSFTEFIKYNPSLDYIDRFLTERQDEKNAES
jgi:hypothetical protein